MFTRKINSVALSQHTGIPQPTLHRILSGKSRQPRSNTVQAIAHYFNISVAQLSGEQALSELAITSLLPANLRELPYLAWNELTVNTGKLKIKLPANKTLITDDDQNRPLSEQAFALRYSEYDTTMEPLFLPGCLLIIDPQKKAEHSGYVLISTGDNQLLLRQLLVDGERYFLKALSNAFGQVEPQDINDSNAQIIATVAQVRQQV